MEINLEDIKNKNSRIGKVSFIFGLATFLFLTGVLIHDMLTPLAYNNDTQSSIDIRVVVNSLAFINIIGIILGIIALFKKGYRRNLGISGIILNFLSSIFPISIIIMAIAN
ncbi:MAG: hypothetical protein H7Y18_01485 [Clostridiaceae bacterium]|nr:hypothetical protein [Clostridiaceae bacterium]